MRFPCMRPVAVGFVLGLVAILGPWAGVAQAQYFGRNKVQYEDFDFKTLKTEHFDILYYPEAQEAVEQAGRMAERWYARLSRLFNHELSGRQVVILYADHPDFEQTTALLGSIDEATGGVTEAFKRRVVLPMAGSLAETDHVLGHELVHAFQFDITTQSRSAIGGGFPTAWPCPSGSSRACPSTCLWAGLSAYGDVAARCGTPGRLPELPGLGQPEVLPLSLWSWTVGLHRRPLG